LLVYDIRKIKMIKQFISQNIGGGVKINNSYLYFYGPNYTTTVIKDTSAETLNTTDCLFGVSFDYPLECDDNGDFFKITAELTLTTHQNVTSSILINKTVTILPLIHTGIGEDNKNFAIPGYLSYSISAIKRMVLKSATIEVLNPNSKYMYTNPTKLETGGEYIAVTSNLYMDNSQFGSYQGVFNADLYNSSQGILTLKNPISRDFSAGTQPYLTALSTTWAKRTDLVSSLIRAEWKLRCLNLGGMASDMYMGVNYYITSYDYGGEIDTAINAVEHIPIPIVSGQSQIVISTNYIDESVIGDYLIFNIYTYLR
jgi:hypothetical protein